MSYGLHVSAYINLIWLKRFRCTPEFNGYAPKQTKLTEKTNYSLASCRCNNQCHYMNEKIFQTFVPGVALFIHIKHPADNPNALVQLYSCKTLNKPPVQLYWLALSRLCCIGHTGLLYCINLNRWSQLTAHRWQQLPIKQSCPYFIYP